MMHPSMRPDIARRREKEFEQAKTAADVARLQEKWELEDEAIEAAETLQAKEVAELRRRVAKLEKHVSPDGHIFNVMVEVVKEIRKELYDKVAEVDRRQLRFCGTHEVGRAYRANSLVVKRGGLWVAVEDTTKAPGSGAAWQMVTKSGDFNKGPTAA